MAYSKKYSLGRGDFATLTSCPYGRGMVLNGEQVETIVHTKLNSDTTFDVTLVSITRPDAVYVRPTIDTAAAPVNTNTMAAVTFVQKSPYVITVSALGSYTRGDFIITGRADA